MKTIEIMNLLERIDQLIRLRATGSPSEFSKKLKISQSMLYNYLELLKSIGGPIKYSKNDKSYYYEYFVTLNLRYKKDGK